MSEEQAEIQERTEERKLLKITRSGTEIAISWSLGNSVLSMKSNEAPDPALLRALEDLNEFAVDSLPFIAEGYHKMTNTFGVQFDWKGDDNRRNGEIFVGIDLFKNGVVKLKTPKKLADSQLDEKKKPRWDHKAVVQFDIVEKEAFRYVDGERAQMPLAPVNETPKQEQGDAHAAIDQELL